MASKSTDNMRRYRNANNLLGQDERSYKQHTHISYRLTKSGKVRRSDGQLMSIQEAIANENGNYDFYKGRVNTSFEQYYKLMDSPSSISYLTGQDTWDTKTARAYYKSWRTHAQLRVDEARKNVTELVKMEKRTKRTRG